LGAAENDVNEVVPVTDVGGRLEDGFGLRVS
jgi:hypothetical protein